MACCILELVQGNTFANEGKVGILKGNVTIGGLVPVNQPLKYGNCSKDFGSGFGIQRLEAMIFAVKKVRILLALRRESRCNMHFGPPCKKLSPLKWFPFRALGYAISVSVTCCNGNTVPIVIYGRCIRLFFMRFGPLDSFARGTKTDIRPAG